MRLSLNPKRLYKRYLIKYPKYVYKWLTNKSAPHIVAKGPHTDQPVYAQSEY